MRQQVEADLQAINRMMAVASAQVKLQHQSDVSPPWQAVVTLSGTCPDIHAAARDYTWLAAWGKVVARLREQIAQRKPSAGRT